jgi:Ca2+-binding RTX toxin-like protein
MQTHAVVGVLPVHGISDIEWNYEPGDGIYTINVPLKGGITAEMDIKAPAPASAAEAAAFFNESMFIFEGAQAGEIGGTQGANTLQGTASKDTLVAMGGDDVVSGGGGSDRMYGGDGGDRFLFAGAYQDGGEVVDGGLGSDTLDFSGVDFSSLATPALPNVTGGVFVDLSQDKFGGSYSMSGPGGATAWGAGISKVVGVENVVGSKGADTITGDEQGNVLNGGGGSDKLAGLLGSDTYVTDGGDTIREAANAGTDTVLASANYRLAANLENLTLTGSATSGTGNTLANTITGNGAANLLNGGGGMDRMAGGLGNDTYVTDGGDTIVEAAKAGTDRVQSSVSYALGANLENLTLTGSAAINGTGNALANTIVGNGKANWITGGLGRDVMSGGGGADRFDFNAVGETGAKAATRDIITDFKVSGADKIDLSTIDANGAGAGNTAFSFLATKGADFTKAGQLHWYTSGGNTIIEGNTDSDAAAEFSIQLNGIKALAGSDFIL